MKELVEHIARALVDHPEDVASYRGEGPQSAVLELRYTWKTLQSDWQAGPYRKAIRTLLSAGGTKLRKRYTLEIVED